MKTYPNTIVTELVPSSSRKSFYGKARVADTGDRKYLLSYDTVVASVDRDGKTRRHSDYRSNTTDRHILSFIQQCSRDVATGEEFRALPVVGYDSFAIRI